MTDEEAAEHGAYQVRTCKKHKTVTLIIAGAGGETHVQLTALQALNMAWQLCDAADSFTPKPRDATSN